jgi:TPR repeat protein
LGLLYYNGDGVIKDDFEAYACWNVAAAQGYEDARGNRGLLEKEMTASQIEKAQELSKEYYDKYVK